MEDKRLMTVKKMHQLTGASISFLKQLLREGKLKKYRINSAIYVSMAEFEALAEDNSNDAIMDVKQINKYYNVE